MAVAKCVTKCSWQRQISVEIVLQHPQQQTPRLHQVSQIGVDDQSGSYWPVIGQVWEVVRSEIFSNKVLGLSYLPIRPSLNPYRTSGMVGLGQIGRKWDKSGAFSDQILVNLAPPRQMHWNLIWKSSTFVPFGANLTHFAAKPTIPTATCPCEA